MSKIAQKTIVVAPELKIVPVKGAENPMREGTASHKRVAIVLASKRVELALAKGARRSTVRFAVKAGLIKLAA